MQTRLGIILTVDGPQELWADDNFTVAEYVQTYTTSVPPEATCTLKPCKRRTITKQAKPRKVVVKKKSK